MRIRRTESTEDSCLTVFVEDWPDDGESREVFAERMIRMAERLTELDSAHVIEETEGDD